MSRELKKAGLSWLMRMAWRDGKSSYGKLVLFIFSIALGVTAVVSIYAFSETLRDSIAQQSKSLVGADYIIESDKPANEKVQGIIDSLGGAGAREISFLSMAAFPGNIGTKLVEVRDSRAIFHSMANWRPNPHPPQKNTRVGRH